MENEDSNQSAQISVIKYDQNEKKVFISFKTIIEIEFSIGWQWIQSYLR